jgi:hypothetical protein
MEYFLLIAAATATATTATSNSITNDYLIWEYFMLMLSTLSS